LAAGALVAAGSATASEPAVRMDNRLKILFIRVALVMGVQSATGRSIMIFRSATQGKFRLVRMVVNVVNNFSPNSLPPSGKFGKIARG
jgi:hypothetical protein